MTTEHRIITFNKIVQATLEVSKAHWVKHGEPIDPDDVARVAYDVAQAVGETVFSRRVAMTIEEAERVHFDRSKLHRVSDLAPDQLEAIAVLRRAGKL